MNKIKSHIFRKKRYKIVWRRISSAEKKKMKVDAIASCDSPGTKGKQITIDPTISGRDLLRSAMDEGIHACVWDFDNQAVDEMAESISRFLWRIGYRISDKQE